MVARDHPEFRASRYFPFGWNGQSTYYMFDLEADAPEPPVMIFLHDAGYRDGANVRLIASSFVEFAREIRRST